MRVFLMAAVFVLIAGVAFGQTQGGQFGLGIIVGEPTGISAKLWTGANTAVDMAAAWSLDDPNELHLHGDYLFHSFDPIKVEKGRLPIYYGIGGRIKFAEGKNDDIVGIRIPVGLAYLFATAPVDIFIELVPTLDIVPDTDFDLNGGVGARFFF